MVPPPNSMVMTNSQEKKVRAWKRELALESG